jgi:hypothetical protein
MVPAVFAEHSLIDAWRGIAAASALGGKLNMRFQAEVWRNG